MNSQPKSADASRTLRLTRETVKNLRVSTGVRTGAPTGTVTADCHSKACEVLTHIGCPKQ